MKKACIISVVIILILAFFVGCEDSMATRDVLKLDAHSSKQDIILEFDSPHLQKALTIMGIQEKNKGAIFFETKDGRTWLRGEPNEIKNTKEGRQHTWYVNEHVIHVAVKAEGDDYIVRFWNDDQEEVLNWGFNLDAEPDEYFTGLYERTVDGDQKYSWEQGIQEAMDMRGQKVRMMLAPTLGLYSPFYLSSRGYGLFVYGTWPGYFDFCKDQSDAVQITFEGPDLKFKIYTAPNPADIVKAHSLFTGPQILPPKWAFTHWRWRDDHTHRQTYYDGTPVTAPYNSELVEDILMMEAFDIPCGVYWVDRPWALGGWGYNDFEWDPKRMPNPEAMIQWLEGKDIRFLLWIAPWVMGNMAEEALENGYNLKGQKSGLKPGDSRRILVDFTNPEAVQWWHKGLAKVLKTGVKGFKLDRAEEIVPESRDINAWDGRTTRETRNDYPVQYVRATYEITQKYHGDDFVLMPRAGYTGSSRYGVFWGGDIGSPPEGLRAAIVALLKSSIIGYPIWGSDTGGYWQGDMDREVCARWLAFSCFCPLMEVGPTENRGLWDMKKEPHYDTELIAIWRLYAKLHHDLVDYSYALAKETHKTGMPMARPLFLMYPDQPQAWKDWQTYLYGPDLLISPIWQKNKDRHTLYLPEGDRWIDAWDKSKSYDGGIMVEINTPMHKIPIFVREGSGMDLGDLNRLYQESLEIASVKPDLDKLQKMIK